MTETTQELLEFAARAAGFSHLVFNHGKTNAHYSGRLEYMTGKRHHTPWNPLTDDGDSLRLAVALSIQFVFDQKHNTAIANGVIVEADDSCDFDRDTATRLAIVRAAADIGRALA